MTTLMINIWFDENNSGNWDIRWSTELDKEKVIEKLKQIIKKLEEVNQNAS